MRDRHVRTIGLESVTGGFVSVTSRATMEFDLRLTRAWRPCVPYPLPGEGTTATPRRT